MAKKWWLSATVWSIGKTKSAAAKYHVNKSCLAVLRRIADYDVHLSSWAKRLIHSWALRVEWNFMNFCHRSCGHLKQNPRRTVLTPTESRTSHCGRLFANKAWFGEVLASKMVLGETLCFFWARKSKKTTEFQPILSQYRVDYYCIESAENCPLSFDVKKF